MEIYKIINTIEFYYYVGAKDLVLVK